MKPKTRRPSKSKRKDSLTISPSKRERLSMKKLRKQRHQLKLLLPQDLSLPLISSKTTSAELDPRDQKTLQSEPITTELMLK